MNEHVEPIDGAAVETVEVLADGTVVDTVTLDEVAAVVDDEGAVEELVATHVVDTQTIAPDGTVTEVVDTDTVEAVLDADGEITEVVATHEIDTIVVDPDGEATEIVATDTVVADADGEVTEIVDVDVLADTRLEQLDDGSAAVAGAEAVVGSPEALPFEMPARERFASLEDVAETGDARVDAATARLDEVPDLPTSDHVEVYEDVHRRLQDALSDTEVR